MKHILLPTDFSINAWSAILYASELYKEESVNFYVVNVFNADSNVLDVLKYTKPENLLFEKAKENSQLKFGESVLKDAAAGAIYGSRSSAGVVVITTKSGKRGKSVINVEINSGVHYATNLPEMLNTTQY